MIRTHHAIETDNINDIIKIIANSININIIRSILVEDGTNTAGVAYVSIEWDLPQYSQAIENAIKEYIYTAIKESNAHYQVVRHRDTSILDLFQKWHFTALTQKIDAMKELQTACLGD